MSQELAQKEKQQQEKTLTVSCRYIQSGEKHSFQVYSPTTGDVLWSPPDWWNTKEEAEAAGEHVRKRLQEELTGFGFNRTVKEDGTEVYETPDGLSFNDVVGGKAHQIGVALAVHKTTGEYGIALIGEDGDVIMPPDHFYGSIQEAIDQFKANKEKVDATIAKKYGPGRFASNMEFSLSDIEQASVEAEARRYVAAAKAEEELRFREMLPKGKPNEDHVGKPFPCFRDLPAGFDPSNN